MSSHLGSMGDFIHVKTFYKSDPCEPSDTMTMICVDYSQSFFNYILHSNYNFCLRLFIHVWIIPADNLLQQYP
jgi:hypothetical protein